MLLANVFTTLDYAQSNTSLKIHAILDQPCDYEQTKAVSLFEVVHCSVEM